MRCCLYTDVIRSEGSEAAQHVRPAVTGDLPAVMEMKGHLAAEMGLDLDTQLTLEG